jgi:DNA-binding transcriptional ArsR family regulator
VSEAQGDTLGAIFRALGDPTRRLVVERLRQGDAVTLNALAADLPITRQAVAKHLATLERSGLVSHERSGRETHFTLHPEVLGDAAAWIARVGTEWDSRLDRLQTLMTRAPNDA